MLIPNYQHVLSDRKIPLTEATVGRNIVSSSIFNIIALWLEDHEKFWKCILPILASSILQILKYNRFLVDQNLKCFHHFFLIVYTHPIPLPHHPYARSTVLNIMVKDWQYEAQFWHIPRTWTTLVLFVHFAYPHQIIFLYCSKLVQLPEQKAEKQMRCF